jgi:hypothetical protein
VVVKKNKKSVKCTVAERSYTKPQTWSDTSGETGSIEVKSKERGSS